MSGCRGVGGRAGLARRSGAGRREGPRARPHPHLCATSDDRPSTPPLRMKRAGRPERRSGRSGPSEPRPNPVRSPSEACPHVASGDIRLRGDEARWLAARPGSPVAVKAALRHVPNRAARTLLPNARILSHYVTGKFFFWPICDAIIYNTEFLFTHFQMLLGTFPLLRWVCRTRNALKQKPACCGARERWRRRAQSAAAAARGRREVPGSPGEPRRAPGGAREHRAQRAGLATVCFSSLASWGPHGSVHSFRSDSAACLSCDRGAECLASHSRFPHL